VVHRLTLANKIKFYLYGYQVETKYTQEKPQFLAGNIFVIDVKKTCKALRVGRGTPPYRGIDIPSYQKISKVLVNQLWAIFLG